MTPPEDSLKLVGTTIADKYAIESVVGTGGFAIVYRATHIIWKRPVAIKVFKALSEIAEGERDKLLQDFIQEGALLAELSERSAAICQARDIGTLQLDPQKKEWLPFMVLEWLEGAGLDVVLAREKEAGRPPRTLAVTLRLLQPAAEALALAHRRGIAHRDIKPANIFLCGDPEQEGIPVKLLDFGIAKVVQDAQKAGGTFTKTAGQVTSFTPSYGAPEQFSRSYGPTGPWTDVFSFALMLVEVIAQKDPLEGDDFMQIAYASGDKTRRPTPRNKGVEVPDAIEAIFMKALAVNPTERYPTMGEFWDALSTVLPAASLRRLVETNPARLSGSGLNVLGQTEVLSAAVTGPGSPYTTSPSTSATQRNASASRVKTAAFVGGAVLLAGVGGGAYLALSHSASGRGSATPVASTSALAAAPAATASTAPTPACPDTMIWIPGGSFFMGAADNDLPMAKPAHRVTLPAYCIDRFEVTVERFKSLTDIGRLQRPLVNDWKKITDKDRATYDPLCTARDPEGKKKHPINCVDWNAANDFCDATGSRLPTEAEWEFAARGEDGRTYPWGDDTPTGSHLNACGIECVAWGKKNGVELHAMYQTDDGWATTAPVGSFPNGKSRYGVEDVVGNVWEWVSDWWAPYTKDAQNDPKGPPTGKNKVMRGGCWNAEVATWLRPSFRYGDDPEKKSYGVGFRCARSVAAGAGPAGKDDAGPHGRGG